MAKIKIVYKPLSREEKDKFDKAQQEFYEYIKAQKEEIIMETENYLDPEQLTKLQHKIWDIARAHGWHDVSQSHEHWCGLVLTEMAEAIEADRNNNKRANSTGFHELLINQAESIEGLSDYWYDMWYCIYYKEYIKGSIEEEFADVVIRLLDMAQEIHGDKMNWYGYYPCGEVFNKNKSFIENAWVFIREVLNWGTMNLSDSVSFMFAWAHHLDIDLWLHISWKMKYNQLRPYKHGGKKY